MEERPIFERHHGLVLVTRGDALSGEPLMDAELLIAAAPGWVPTMPHADVPEQWGQATVEVMEHLEPHPLGRAGGCARLMDDESVA